MDTDNTEILEESFPEETETPSKEDNAKAKKKKKDKRQGLEEIEALEKSRDEAAERYLRTLAEFDNFRKRTSREKAVMYDDGVRDVAARLLPVVDSFERAMAAAGEEDGMVKGFAMILRQLKGILKELGVEEINAAGKAFDPNLHEAVMHIDDEAYGQNEVAEELLKGYIYKDKPLRHSMVKVAN